MIRWWKGLTFKSFLTIAGLITVIIGILFLVFYVFLPTYYYDEQLNQHYKELNKLKKQAIDLPFSEAESELYQFYSDTNIKFVILDSNREVVFPLLKNLSAGQKELVDYPVATPITQRLDNFVGQSKIVFKGENYFVTYSMPLIAKNESRRMLSSFLFIVLAISFFLTVVGAWLFSKRLTNPIVKMEKTANQMAKLDFSAYLQVTRADELGSLSKSLNSLSENIQKSLEQLNLANEQLELDKDILKFEEEKRKELITIISHELKSPISAVMGQTEAMLLNVGPYQDRDLYLKSNYEIMREMKIMADEMENIAKVDYVNLMDKLVEMDIVPILKSVVSKQKSYYNNEIKTSLRLPTTFIITTELVLFEKALDNIISNAYKYCSTRNGLPKEVCVSLDSSTGRLEIVNTAESIEETALEHLFDPFYRIEKSKSRLNEGSGLGLYITSKNLKKLKIPYKIENVQNGIRFVLMLA